MGPTCEDGGPDVPNVLLSRRNAPTPSLNMPRLSKEVAHVFNLRSYLCGAAFLMSALNASAQGTRGPDGFPNRYVKIIVPYGAGGAADLLSRVVGRQLSAYWGQPVVVENVPGGTGSIGIGQLVRSAPDGYTIGCIPISNLVVNPHLYPDLKYNVFKDLAPISRIAEVQNVLLVSPSLRVDSIRQLVEMVKAKPGTFTYSSLGVGSQAHIAGEMFNTLFGVKTIHVPYNRSSAALTDVFSGVVNFIFAQAPTALPFINGGQMKALAVASSKRSAYLPDVPTIQEETGVQGFETVAWSAFMAPTGTPKSVRNFIASEIKRALMDPDVRTALKNLSAEAVGSTPDELASFMQSEHTRYSEIIRRIGIRAE